ncbi:MAG: histone deacetylase [Rhodobacterales bacterium]|nr:histone deacetylase [Rhodobacterales bacterium]
MPNHQFPLYFHEIYSSGLDRTARFPVDRYQLLAKKLSESDEKKLLSWQTPRLACQQEIQLVHEQDYVERFFNHQLTEKEIRRIGLRPWKEAIVERTLRLTGGALQALEQVLVYGHTMAGNMAGGTHHAFRKEGAGYCIFNDLAICAEKALLNSAVEKILILDLDVHQGNGTAAIFSNHKDVFTFSMHGEKNYPFRKETSDWDIGLADQTDDATYLRILADALDDLHQKVQPDFVFYLCGVDVIAQDKLGRLGLSVAGCKQRDEMVLQWCRRHALPVQCSMGGGYVPDLSVLVEAHANTFRLAQDIYF